MCPGTDESIGKRGSGATGPGNAVAETWPENSAREVITRSPVSESRAFATRGSRRACHTTPAGSRRISSASVTASIVNGLAASVYSVASP
jgi:hypothetical protein